ncbi:2'-5' RNA ligase family protein [Sinomicrobium weinanense]|uniref:2'-5' RNA ligase family protein n=1 Tax=Sinomicrobium weinanense TaxID=2842200 RepID=A0A926Q323_9FLAO|nr:2'-5' RNA ligase family protein [Sinomicrobium weinanense]MBC9795551.1 2'-5' RNA ligase family protein [Sinomicrobium weinanense]MBU3124572.1 2'-5' RNA ligase family protein [Sinomicrobium weinanense]
MYQNLYFIAIVPPDGLKERVKSLKEELKDKYGVKHALKSPAHITLQMPFKRVAAYESRIVNALEEFAGLQRPFPVILSGFNCFSPRVIFVKVEDHAPIVELHAGLRHILTGKLNFTEKEITHRFHPHMTIATRDLTEALFREAWPEYEKRELTASFTASSLCLLKHNGKCWEEYREFGFIQK